MFVVLGADGNGETDKTNSEHDYIRFCVWDASGKKAINLLEECDELELVSLIKENLFPKVKSTFLHSVKVIRKKTCQHLTLSVCEQEQRLGRAHDSKASPVGGLYADDNGKLHVNWHSIASSNKKNCTGRHL